LLEVPPHIIARPKADDFWLEVAKAFSLRSTCIVRRFGAVLVKNNILVGAGYNGSMRGSINCSDVGFCRKRALGGKEYEYDLCMSVHAEENTILNSNVDDRIGATLYITSLTAEGITAVSEPCRRCKRLIVNSQIGRVVIKAIRSGVISYNPNDWVREDILWHREAK